MASPGLSRGLMPFEGKVLHLARFRHVFRGPEGLPKNRQLAFLVPGPSQGSGKGKLDGYQTGYSHRLREVGNVGQADGGYARFLDCVSDQSHGPAADGSGRYQENEVHLVVPEARDDFRNGILQE
jgi:hypothetical protein